MLFKSVQKCQICVFDNFLIHKYNRSKWLMDNTFWVWVCTNSNTTIFLWTTECKWLVEDIIQWSLNWVVWIFEGQNCASWHVRNNNWSDFKVILFALLVKRKCTAVNAFNSLFFAFNFQFIFNYREKRVSSDN